MKELKNCPVCGSFQIHDKYVEQEFEYKKHKIIIPNYKIVHCNRCEEEFCTDDYSKIGDTLKALRSFVNSKEENDD